MSFDVHQDPQGGRFKNTRTEYLPLAFQHKLAYLLTFPRLRKIIRAFQPDVVHAHYVSSYGVTGALAGFHPYVISVWGTDIFEAPRNSSIMRKLVEFAFRRSDVVCSTSQAMKEETEKYTNKPVVLTPFGVDTVRFSPQPRAHHDFFTFGLVKSMEPVYGIDYLLKAYHLLGRMVSPEIFAQTRLVLVGGGPQMGDYQTLAKELGLSQHVEFRGKIPHDQVPTAMNEFDVFVMPSVQESFGVSALEAQACGVPVIVTNVGGIPEVLEEGKTGYMVEPRDPQALAEKMLYLLQQEALRMAFSQAAREFVLERYDWEKNAKGMEDLYHELKKE